MIRLGDWYVLYVLTGREKAILAELMRRGYRALAPSRIMLELRGGIWREVERLMLPGYLFVYTDDLNRAMLDSRTIVGVMRFLGANGPETVTASEMERMLVLANAGRPWGISEAHKECETLVIHDGPLVGWEDSIVKLDTRRHRAKVALTVLGEQKIIELAICVVDDYDPATVGE